MFSVKVLSDHNNFQSFMIFSRALRNHCQVQWIETLSVYDFFIKHHSEKTNSFNVSFKRSDYKSFKENNFIHIDDFVDRNEFLNKFKFSNNLAEWVLFSRLSKKFFKLFHNATFHTILEVLILFNFFFTSFIISFFSHKFTSRFRAATVIVQDYVYTFFLNFLLQILQNTQQEDAFT